MFFVFFNIRLVYYICMRFILVSLILFGCAGTWTPHPDFEYKPINTDSYDIATYQHITNSRSPVHIYIEGDGHAFNAHGMATNNPTPRGTMMRDLTMRDTSANVAYIARPCQFIMSPTCTKSDWTDGRFSEKIIDSMAVAIKDIAGTRPIILVGYSGGGLLAGLIINRHPEIKVKKWITIAGVPNHTAWTQYFGDSPLIKSLDLDKLPNTPAVHYIGLRDRVVPPELSRKFFRINEIREIPDAGHGDFANIDLDFNI